MALPKHYVTDAIRHIEKAALEHTLETLESLTPGDVQLIGAFIQQYNFLELNLRRAVRVFSLASMVGAPHHPRSADLTSWAKKAVSSMEPDQENIIESLERLEEIEYRWPFRNLLAHWAAKRIPGHDALILFSADNKDHSGLFGHIPSWDHCAYSILTLPDLRGLVQHIEDYERWMAMKAAEWCLRYVDQ